MSATDAKLHLRVDHADEDALISSIIVAARRHVETITGLALVSQTWKVFPADWPDENHLVLPLPPLQSVTHVKYTDTAGSQSTWAASNYEVDTARRPGRIVLAYLKTWPTATLKASNPIEVQFVAGFGAAAEVPGDIRQALLLLVAHWYRNREAVVLGQTSVIDQKPLPLGVDALLANWRF